MPTYDYECQKCGHHFEKFQSMSDPVLKSCPKCRGKVNRMIGSGAGLLFKGDGFYITDYRSKSYQEKAKSDAAGAAKSAESGATKSADSGTSSGTAGDSTATKGGGAAPAPTKSEVAPKAPKTSSGSRPRQGTGNSGRSGKSSN